jgi:hypothetical protein
MGKERRENNPARVAKIYQSAGFSFDHGMHSPGDYKLNDGRLVTENDDEKAQNTFKNRGYNKGKAKDMAKNLSKNVEKSLPESSPASENYDGAPYEQWKVTEPRGI